MKKESKLTGIPVVSGWGMGSAYFVGRAVQQTSTVSISRQDVGDEIMRLTRSGNGLKKTTGNTLLILVDLPPLMSPYSISMNIFWMILPL